MKRFLLYILCSLFPLSSWSYYSDMIIEHYSVEQGLLNNVVNYTLKGKDGFIWFGTWYGLCRFDGTKFKAYNDVSYGALDIPPRKIQRIVEDKNGFLWINTVDRKLSVFNKKIERFRTVYDDMKQYSKNIQVIKIQRTIDGDVLILTKDKNLLLANTDKEGNISIKTLFDSRDKINPYNYRLNHNELSETKEYLSWIGTDYKINSFRKGEVFAKRPNDFIISKLKNTLSEANLTCMFDGGNRVWVGEATGTFYAINLQNGEMSKYDLPEIKGAITNLLVTSGEVVYLSVLGQGTYEYSLKSRKLYRINLNLNENAVSYAYADQYDKIWFHENANALVYYDPLTHSSHRFPFKHLGQPGALQVEDAGDRGLFFLTPDGDVWLFDRDSLAMVSINSMKQLNDDQPDQSFLDLFMDDDRVLWLSSATQGIYKLNFPKKQFRLIIPPTVSLLQKDSKLGVRALFQTHDGDIWVGTRLGNVYRMDKHGKVQSVFRPETSDKIGKVYHIMEDNDGNLWFSTKGDGLVKAIPDKSSSSGFRFIRFKNDPADSQSISGNDIYFTYQDKKGRIWVGAFGGGLNLLERENGKVCFRNKNNGFTHYPLFGLYLEIRNMVEDNAGRMWVGTTDGLMSFELNFSSVEQIQFETYRKKMHAAFADSDVYALYKDDSSQIWISVFGGGLNRLIRYDKANHQPIFKSYGIREGLKKDVLISLIEDDRGRLWFTTENGLSYFDKHAKQVRNFGRYDGLPVVEMEDNTAMKTSDGELWLGTKQGIIAFSPDKLESQYSVYKTYIVNCEVSNQNIQSFVVDPIIDCSITYADKIVLKHNQSMFTFEFAALNYDNQNRVSYKYILEGYEREWHFNGTNRIAAYTNVPPGKYLFKVQTIDEADPDLHSECQLQVIILPPWWASWWAYTIYACVAIFMLIVAFKVFFFMVKAKNDIYIEQKLSELKIKFFTNISHELRTPLTLIQGPIQELKEKETLSEKGKQYISLMEKSIAQMLQLVNQILDFRKIQNGKMRLHVSLINMNEMVASFEREFHVLSEENEVGFTFQIPDDEIRVWGDKEKLGIVIRNILSNAFKYTPSGGNIFVTLGLTEDGKSCYIQVEDDGEGIPQDKLMEIFERFSQVRNTRNAYYQGTGIGLALSKEIINLHHGDIYAESPDEQGATFIVKLLLDKNHYKPSEVDFYVGEEETTLNSHSEEADDMQQISHLEDVPRQNAALPSLLIVEDNKDLCNMLKLQLEDKFNIYLANDGVEGLRKVHLYHPDIVVTDQMMPDMDGMELLRRIRDDFQVSHIPVIILTAKSNDEAKTKAISMGANAYITKPFSKDYLIARIEQLLKERRLFREKVWSSAEEQSEDTSYEQYLVKKDLQFITQIHKVIEENLDNSDFNIDTIASTIGLSRSAFFKKLKSLTGFAPVDLVKEIRLNKSIDLIKNSGMSISEIAFEVGFKDSGYFSKCFRKKYNQTPREYMTEWRKN